MVPDIGIKDYYLNYIHNAEQDIKQYTEYLEEVKIRRDDAYDYLTRNKDKLTEYYNINLNYYKTEWLDKSYNPEEKLYNVVEGYVKNGNTEVPNRAVLLQLLKYLKALKLVSNYETIITMAYDRAGISFREFQGYARKYYNQVQATVLQGMGYKFNNGIGILIINCWRMPSSGKSYVDFAKTKKAKQALIDKGLKPYDEEEAKWYKEQGIPYDGVKYAVFQKQSFYYDTTVICSKILHNRKMRFKRTEYINRELRGLSYIEIADKYVKTFEDIINLQINLQNKLNILLYISPNSYLKFIRNAGGIKYKH